MQVKTQKQVMVLQNKAQKVADKLNEEVIVIAKGVQHIQVQSGTAYQLNAIIFMGVEMILYDDSVLKMYLLNTHLNFHINSFTKR